MLDSRGFRFQSTVLEDTEDLSFDKEWAAFAKQCDSQVVAETAWANYLWPVLVQSYDEETQFDRALFRAMGMSVNNGVGRDGDVFSVPVNDSVGFARQVQKVENLGFPLEYGISRQTRKDHNTVIFNDEGSVEDETATVEIKMSDTNCKPFELLDFNAVKKVDLRSDHGALGQTIIYVAGDLYHCLTRRGYGEKSLPVVVLAGKSSKCDPSRLCSVWGKLKIPKITGGRFTYNVDGFLEFSDDEESLYKRAMAVYIRTMCAGIRRALDILAHHPQPTVALSGREFCIGRHPVADGELIASPIPRSSFSRGPSPIKISQGELFSARVKLSELVESAGFDFVLLPWADDRDTTKEYKVKITSRYVHSFAVALDHSIPAMERLNRMKELDLSLLGFFKMPNSITTVMKNLDDFTDLRPSDLVDSGVSVLALWDAFSDLIKRTLLPMACQRVVFADLRPGWDRTYNILCRSNDDGIRLELVDWESLAVHPNDLSIGGTAVFIPSSDSKYPSSYSEEIRYLWWQCMIVAYMWLLEVPIGDCVVSEFVHNFEENQVLKGCFETEEWNAFTAVVDNKDPNQDEVHSLLDVVRGVIQKRASASQKNR